MEGGELGHPHLPRRRPPGRAAIALLACLALGCATPAGPTGPTSASAAKARAGGTSRPGTPAPAGTPAPVIDRSGALSPLTPVLPSPTPAVAPTAGATPAPPALVGPVALVGKVRLPAPLLSVNGAGIVSDNGAGVISNNGASLISNNGGSIFDRPRYRLTAAPAEVPVAGAVVELIDAKGLPLAGPDGKPWRATTGSDGTFELRGTLPAANVLAAVDLGPKGVALAAVVRGQDGTLTIDTVSSLTAGYILAQYVRPQADPLATFDRLTPAAEADTRREAAGALGAGAAPPSLLADDVVSAVDALRRATPALDGQLEVVRKLLIAAGQADQGNGQVATNVALDLVSDVTTAADGTVYFGVYHQHRIFRLKGDRLEAVVGTGADGGQAPAIEGKRATEAALDHAADVLAEAAGTLAFRDGAGTVWRVKADGTLARLHAEEGGNLGVGLLAGPGGEVWAAYEQILEEPAQDGTGGRSRYRVVAIGAGGVREAAAFEAAHGVQEVTGDPASGALWVMDRQGRRRLDLGTKALGPYDGAVPDGARWTFDEGGAVYVEGDGGLSAIAPGATAGDVVLAEVPSELMMATGFPLHRAADGTWYFRDFNSVYRLRAGAVARVAGTGGQGGEVGGDATNVAIESPGSIVAGPGGVLYVADNGAGRVLKYAPGKPVEALSDPEIPNPGWLRIGPGGALYVLHDDGGNGGPAIFRFGATGGVAGGAAEQVFAATALGPQAAIADFAVTPTGALVMRMLPDEGGDAVVLRRREPDGQLVALPDPPTAYFHLALDAQGVPHLAGDDKVWRLAGQAWTEIGRFTLAGTTEFRRLAIDPKGRCYTIAGPILTGGLRAAVVRLDPATGQTTVVAGQGGMVLGGDKPDDGLGYPLDDLALGPTGDLYVSDRANRQVKRAPAAALE